MPFLAGGVGLTVLDCDVLADNVYYSMGMYICTIGGGVFKHTRTPHHSLFALGDAMRLRFNPCSLSRAYAYAISSSGRSSSAKFVYSRKSVCPRSLNQFQNASSTRIADGG